MTALDKGNFDQALDEARRSGEAASADRGLDSFMTAKVRARVDFGREHGGGGEARWGLAMNWVDEPNERLASTAASAPRPAPASADTAETIASELGVAVALTERQLRRRWRAFVWRNHPDRQPADARDEANARVAIANMLYDQARRQLIKAQ